MREEKVEVNADAADEVGKKTDGKSGREKEGGEEEGKDGKGRGGDGDGNGGGNGAEDEGEDEGEGEDGNGDEDGDGDEDEKPVAEEPQDLFELTWEQLECARVVLDGLKDRRDDRLAEVLETLGDFGMENDNFEQAAADYQSAIDLLKKVRMSILFCEAFGETFPSTLVEKLWPHENPLLMERIHFVASFIVSRFPVPIPEASVAFCTVGTWLYGE